MTGQINDRRPVITSITLYWSDNYVNYSDTDLQSDYHNSYTLNQKSTIEWLQKDSADIIHVDIVNCETDSFYFKRIVKMAKAINYRIAICHVNSKAYGDYNEYYLYDPLRVNINDIRPRSGHIIGD